MLWMEEQCTKAYINVHRRILIDIVLIIIKWMVKSTLETQTHIANTLFPWNRTMKKDLNQALQADWMHYSMHDMIKTIHMV